MLNCLKILLQMLNCLKIVTPRKRAGQKYNAGRRTLSLPKRKSGL